MYNISVGDEVKFNKIYFIVTQITEYGYLKGIDMRSGEVYTVESCWCKPTGNKFSLFAYKVGD